METSLMTQISALDRWLAELLHAVEIQVSELYMQKIIELFQR